MVRTIKTYSTAERATHGDFWIRNEIRKPFVEHAHRHEFFQIQFNLNNILDKTYWVGGYDYLRLFPGAPRNWLTTVAYTF